MLTCINNKNAFTHFVAFLKDFYFYIFVYRRQRQNVFSFEELIYTGKGKHFSDIVLLIFRKQKHYNLKF